MTVSNRLLQIDAFRQAVGSDQQPLLGFGHVVDARAPVLGGQRAGDRLDAQLREGLAKTRRDVIGGGDEAAEDDRVGAVGDERLQHLRRSLRASDRAPWSGPRPAPQGCRAVPLRPSPGAGSTSTASASSASSSKTCSSSRSGSAARRLRSALDRRGRRRADAAHQRQCAPEGEPSPTLVRPGAFDDAEAVVEHRIVEGPMLRAQIVRALGRFVAREDALLAPVPAGDVDAPSLHEMAGEPDPRRPRCRAKPPANSSSSRLSRRSNAASSPLCGVAVSRIRCRSRSSASRFSSSKRCWRL